MEDWIAYIFRFVAYAGAGLLLEMTSNLGLTDLACGFWIKRRFPKKWLEGMVSYYMLPLHGFGMLFVFEAVHGVIGDLFILWRYLIWAILFTIAEALWGVICDKVLGFYPWNYYGQSKYRIFKKGYTLWTLIPFWGIAGLIFELYSNLLIFLSPFVVTYFN